MKWSHIKERPTAYILFLIFFRLFFSNLNYCIQILASKSNETSGFPIKELSQNINFKVHERKLKINNNNTNNHSTEFTDERKSYY